MAAKNNFRGKRVAFCGGKTKLSPGGRKPNPHLAMSSVRETENAPFIFKAERVRLRENGWSRKTRLI